MGIDDKYLFRIDDVCPEMDREKFERLVKIFNKYNVKPIVGVIPNNKDKCLSVGKVDKGFWKKIKKLADSGWVIAQHGYEHVYVNKNSGLMKIARSSEFAGLNYKQQYAKIYSGKKILENKLGLRVQWWMAPSHSFDDKTCRVLRKLDFKYITDGFFLKPIKRDGLAWVPQQLWRPLRMPFGGIWTICIHPNTYDDYDGLENFIKNNLDKCTEVEISEGKLSFSDKLFDMVWHLLLNGSHFINGIL